MQDSLSIGYGGKGDQGATRLEAIKIILKIKNPNSPHKKL
jgi:hypothetical protein